MTTAAVIMAAGGSSRMGSLKQLIQIHGRSLLRCAAEAACAAQVEDVVIVLGHEAARLRGELRGLRARVVENAAWQTGMRSSLQAGIRALAPETQAALFMVCDQPHVTTEHLNALIDALPASGLDPVASGYSGTVGVPAIIPRTYFADLLALPGETGAKSFLLAHAARIKIVPFPGGEADIDTPADLASFL